MPAGPQEKRNETLVKPPGDAGAGSHHFLLTLLWSDDPGLVARADRAGIDRIGLDLESLGKAERQRGLGTWVSAHRREQLRDLRKVVTRAELFCRVNPINADSGAEIDAVLDHGVDVLMLPMFTTTREVETFIALVAGRAKVVLLLEHRLAVDRIEEIARMPGIDCIHVGLTDLSLSLGVANRFALLASARMERLAATVRSHGVRLCIGGIGRAMDVSQKIPTDAVYAQHPRLGSTGALISRAFFGPAPEVIDVEAEVSRCRQRMAHWWQRSAAELDIEKSRFAGLVGSCDWT